MSSAVAQFNQTNNTANKKHNKLLPTLERKFKDIRPNQKILNNFQQHFIKKNYGFITKYWKCGN